jgi:hypothetical protein
MSPVRKSETPGSRLRRCYRRRGSLSLAAAGSLPWARASCRPMASAIRRMRGSRDSPLSDPLSLAGQGPCRSSSSAIPTLPRQDPSDENSQEFQDGSQKFESSTCGVEMLACGETLPALPCLTCMASPCRAGDIRSRPQAGGAGRANSASLEGMASVWPHGDKQVTMLGTLTAPAPVSCRSPIRCRLRCA